MPTRWHWCLRSNERCQRCCPSFPSFPPHFSTTSRPADAYCCKAQRIGNASGNGSRGWPTWEDKYETLTLAVPVAAADHDSARQVVKTVQRQAVCNAAPTATQEAEAAVGCLPCHTQPATRSCLRLQLGTYVHCGQCHHWLVNRGSCCLGSLSLTLNERVAVLADVGSHIDSELFAMLQALAHVLSTIRIVWLGLGKGVLFALAAFFGSCETLVGLSAMELLSQMRYPSPDGFTFISMLQLLLVGPPLMPGLAPTQLAALAGSQPPINAPCSAGSQHPTPAEWCLGWRPRPAAADI